MLRVFAIALIVVFYQTNLAASQDAPTKKITPVEQSESENSATQAVDAPAADDAIARAKRTFDGLRQELSNVRKTINLPNATIEELVDSGGNLAKLRKKIKSARGALSVPIADFAARLNELGPAPKKGESETEGIASQRSALTEKSNDLNAALKQLDLLGVEAGQLSSQAAELQKIAFGKRVFVSRKSAVNPQLWIDFSTTIPDAIARSFSVMHAWHKPASQDSKLSGSQSFFVISGIFIIAILLVFFVWSKMSRPPNAGDNVSDLRRVLRAVGGIAFVTIIGFASLFFSLGVLEWSTVGDLRIKRVVTAISEMTIGITLIVTVMRAVLAPSNSLWRLYNINDIASRKLYRYGVIAAIVFGLDRGASALSDIIFMPLEFVVGTHALVAILLIVLLAKFISTGRSSDPLLANIELHSDRRFYFTWAHRFFVITWLLVVVSVFGLVLGYVALAHFILTNVLVTGAMIVTLYLVHHLVDAAVTSSTQPWSRIGKLLRSRGGFGDETIRRLGLVLSTATDVSVILIGLPLVLALLTITWVDFPSLVVQVFSGFKIGDIFIEPSKIFLAIFMLIAGVLIVRAMSVWLDRRILDRSNIDAGVQNSIATGVKYTGVLLAGGFALTAAGLDFSKLAIVAGALSVGIGFGLQSVVSNFVSGLILLAERPISIGDWIEVGAGEGVVKKINVRSTEIETFDRCSVIVPNSSFISDPVKNWSLGSSVGRIKVNVGVGYGSDPDQVQAILLKCAEEHENVISSPSPKVMFMDFGASSLDFQLRVFLDDIGWCTAVASDLRFAIFRDLTAAGIEIPFPQRDINIRDVDKIAQAVTKKAAARKPKKPTKK